MTGRSKVTSYHDISYNTFMVLKYQSLYSNSKIMLSSGINSNYNNPLYKI